MHDMDFELRMRSRGHFVPLGWRNIKLLALIAYQRGGFFVHQLGWWPPFEYSWFLSVVTPLIFAHWWLVLIFDKVSTSRPWHLGTTEFLVMTVMGFMLVACGATGYQFAALVFIFVSWCACHFSGVLVNSYLRPLDLSTHGRLWILL